MEEMFGGSKLRQDEDVAGNDETTRLKQIEKNNNL